MKNIFKTKFSFKKFLIALFAIYVLALVFNAGKFFWQHRDMSKQNISILTQNDYTSEGFGNLHIILKNIENYKPINKAEVKIWLEDTNSKKIADLSSGDVFSGRLDIGFKLPKLESGSYNIATDIRSSQGHDLVKKTITIKSEEKLVITTDRPLYKPGQTINWRVLLLDKLTLEPVRSKDITIAITDPSNNKLFRKNFKTSAYGIISSSYSLAEQIAFGEYKIEATSGENIKEKTVEVKDFQLPKFEVSLTTKNDLTKPQDTIDGQVVAKFFYGQPVASAKTIVTVDIDGRKQTQFGNTNNDGIFNFGFINSNTTSTKNINITAEVIDQNQNKISNQKSFSITQENIIVELFPESGKLKPGLDNEILIVASRSNGEPVQATIFMTGEKLREFATNEDGIAKFSYRPDQSQLTSIFSLDVRDEFGNVTKKSFTLENDANNAGYLLLRADKTLYDNQTIIINISATQDKPAQIEFMQDGMVLHSEYVDIKNGKGEKTITIPEKIFGTIELRAIQTFNDDEVAKSKHLADYERYSSRTNNDLTLVNDSKIIFIDNAKNLNIAITSDKDTYLPGEDAKFSFKITDKNNTIQNSALGVKVVDEALLALGSDKDNLSKLMFLVDDNVRDYAQSLNGLTWEDLIKNNDSELNNIILQAMMQKVPRETVSFAKQDKNNSSAWYSYKNQREETLTSIIMLGMFLLIILHLRFWQLATKISFEKGVTSRLFAMIVAAFVIVMSAGTIFIPNDNQYYWRRGFWYKIGTVFEFIFEKIVGPTLDAKYFFPSLVTILCIATVSLWYLFIKKKLFNKYKQIAKIYSIAIISLLLLVILDAFKMGVSIIDDEILKIVTYVNLSLIIMGFLYILATYFTDNKELTLFSAISITLMGVFGVIFFPIIIPIFIMFIILGLARTIRKDHKDVDKELENLKQALIKKGEDESVIELRLYFLEKKLRRETIFRKVSRVIAYLLFIVIGGMFIFYIILSAINFFRYQPMMTATSSDSDVDWNDDFDSSSAGFSSSNSSSRSGGIGFEYGTALGLGTRDMRAGNILSPLLKSFSFPATTQETTSQNTKATETKIVLSKEEVLQKAKRVRKFFPETMYWQAELIAENGTAELNIPMKDSITNWRISTLANSLSGKVGSADKNVIVFQDFFIDFDIPYNLTQGDEFWLPITINNYLSETQKIKLDLKEASFYTWLEGGKDMIELQPSESRNVYVKLRLEKHGDYILRIESQGTKMADAMEKIVNITPFGQHITQAVANEKLNEAEAKINAIFPSDKIAGTEKIIAKLYPSIFSEIVQGLDSMLRMPSGCFEQTSSSLYPNILILKYLNKSGQESPEIREKAEDFIAQGLQKLLTYELEPGGFSYFGSQPTETILSAYGLMEFTEMRGATFVDEDLITRTRNFLYNNQNGDGSFKLTGYHQGGFSGNNDIAKNAYIIWALSEADPKNPNLAKSIKYLENNFSEIKQSSYALALTANAFINVNPKTEFAKKAISELKQIIERNETNMAFIKIDKPNYYGSYGQSGNIEVTALAAIAFANLEELDFSDRLVAYIVSAKTGSGSWGSTQSTILALKALTENEIAKKIVSDNLGSISLTLNNNQTEKINITSENSEVVQTFIFDKEIKDNNEIKVTRDGNISATIQIIKDYYKTWDSKPSTSSSFAIQQNFDTPTGDTDKNLKLGQTNNLNLTFHSKKYVKNAIVEISIPAGFEIDQDALSCQLKEISTVSSACNITNKAIFDRFELKGGQLILYYNELEATKIHHVIIKFTPRTVGQFKALPSRIYAYYDPFDEAYSQPIYQVNVEYFAQ
jgi:uncharacterized protein YfaS (alpha-2-macroglobulin family)